jgi:hypothetical protein
MMAFYAGAVCGFLLGWFTCALIVTGKGNKKHG